jgi:hypothetical protein
MIVSLMRSSRLSGPEIDVTPGAGWRRVARGVVSAVLLALALPLVWLIGAFALGAFLCVWAAMLFWVNRRQVTPERPVAGYDERRSPTT